MKIRSTILLTVLALISVKADAQFTLNWNDTYAHTNAQNFSCESRKVLTDSNGNTIVISDATSNVDDQGNITANTYYYIMLRKYDPSGMLTTYKTLNTGGHQVTGFNSASFFDAALDANDNLYVGYNYYDQFNGFDIRYSKLDNSLSLQWFIKYNPSSKETGKAMAVDTNGVAHILCETESAGVKTYLILKSDNTNQIMDPIYSFDAGLDVLNDIIKDASNNVYVTGYRQAGSSKNILTASVTNGGNLRWKFVVNGSSPSRDDYGTSLTMGQDGFLYVTGSSDRGQGSNSNYDMSVYKHNPVNGKRVWEKFEHYNTNDRGAFIISYDANYIFTASTSNTIIMITRTQKSDGITSGRVLYAPKPDDAYTSIQSATLADFRASTNLKFYVTGTVNAVDPGANNFSAAYLTKFNFTSGVRIGFRIADEHRIDGDASLSYASGAMNLDYINNKILWVRDEITDFALHTYELNEIRALTSSGIMRTGDEIQSSDASDIIHIYPNPSAGIFKISGYTGTTAEVYSLNGSLVFASDSKNTEGELTLDLRHLNKGIYMLRTIDQNQNVIHHKISIQ